MFDNKKPRSRSAVEIISSQNWDFPHYKPGDRDSIVTLKRSRSFDEDYVDVSELGKRRIETLKKFGYVNVPPSGPDDDKIIHENNPQSEEEPIYAKVNKNRKITKEAIYAKVNKTQKKNKSASSPLKKRVAPKKPKRSKSKTPEKIGMSINTNDVFEGNENTVNRGINVISFNNPAKNIIAMKLEVAPKKPKRSISKTPEKRKL